MTHRRPDRSRHLRGERPADLPRRRRPVGGPRPDDGRHPRGVRRRPGPGAPVLRRATRRPRPGPAQRGAPGAGAARGALGTTCYLVTQNIDDLHERGGSAGCTTCTAGCGPRGAPPATSARSGRAARPPAGVPVLRRAGAAPRRGVVRRGPPRHGRDRGGALGVRPLRLDRHLGAGPPGGGVRALRGRQRQGDPRAQPRRERGERRRRPVPSRPGHRARPGVGRRGAGAIPEDGRCHRA